MAKVLESQPPISKVLNERSAIDARRSVRENLFHEAVGKSVIIFPIGHILVQKLRERPRAWQSGSPIVIIARLDHVEGKLPGVFSRPRREQIFQKPELANIQAVKAHHGLARFVELIEQACIDEIPLLMLVVVQHLETRLELLYI